MGNTFEEYSLEMRKDNGDFVEQIGVYSKYSEAEAASDGKPLKDGLYYSIWCIEYDGKDEIAYFPVY